MRMWMTDPKIMCRKHLFGEHVEIHMFVGTINKNISVKGYIDNDLLEPASLHKRHDQLVNEIIHRGYHHGSSLPPVTELAIVSNQDHVINKERSLKELLSRCKECSRDG